MARGVHLLTYADRLAGDLGGLRRLLADGPLAVFSGVHVLPFFVPHDGADAGFDPVDHAAVDPRLGSWADIAELAEAGLTVTADLIVNHVSADSTEFRDWLRRGGRSPWAGMFLTFDAVFPGGGTEEAITAVYRPRLGLPFTPYRLADGTRRLLWTTFLPSQVDLAVAHPVARDYLRRILRVLAAGGVRIVRLDAVGYAMKTPGTDSFMTPQTLEFVREVTAMARAEGLEVLVEVHAHHSQQQAIAPLVDFVYDFALPPLLLHSLRTGTVDRLAQWLDIRPRNAITVLDTHDGIGVVDAGPSGALAGLLDAQEMAAIFQEAADATDGHSARASTAVAWAAMPHQVNATFFSVLGEDATRYLLARAVQLFVPGLPQIYYVGLLAGRNDLDLFASTGVGRDINRHRYSPDEVQAALRTDVVRAQLALVRLRSSHPAFDGTFSYAAPSPSRLVLQWRAEDHVARLEVELDPTAPSFRVDLRGDGEPTSVTSVAALARLAG